MNEFKRYGFRENVLESLDAMGFKNPTPIQEQAIPIIMRHEDLIACAQTGTGKTAAFILPLLHYLQESEHPGIKAMVIVPTRELARQIDQAMEAFAYFTNTSSMAFYGGVDGTGFTNEKQALVNGVDCVITTPGKIIAHLNLGYVDTSQIKHLVLDEADKMLDMGFVDDIMRINKYLPENKQTLFFSATMPPNIRSLAKRLLKNPKEISLAMSKPAEGVLQSVYSVYDKDKLNLLVHLLTNKNLERVIIFVGTKSNVKKIAMQMQKKGLNAAEIHSDLDQNERNQTLLEFKNRKKHFLVATDILSRGIDIEDVELVINYDVPRDAEDYVHRVGRTARANTTGIAITLVSPDDQRNFDNIEKLIETSIVKQRVPEKIGDTPEWNSRAKRPNKRFKSRKK